MYTKNFIETVVGFIIICICFLFIFFVYNHSSETNFRFSQKDSYSIFAEFGNVNGLYIGNDVKINGVNVGKVDGIELDPEILNVKVAISIKSRFKIPDDSIAVINSSGILGNKMYIDLIIGSSENNLSEGSKLSYSRGPLSIESLLNKFIMNWKKSDSSK